MPDDPEIAANFQPAIEQPFADKSDPEPIDPGQPDEPEAAKPDDEPEDDNAPQEEAGDDEAEASEDAQEPDEADDLEEFEWDGKTIAGPKGLKDAVMMQRDYTQKTQEVAAQRKELEAYKQSLDERAQATDEELEVRAEAWAIEAALKQYENIDWAKWAREDPVEAQSARYQFDDLRNRVGESRKKLDEFAAKRSQDMQQDFAKRVGQTREYAQKNIKGFNPDMEKKVVDFAKGLGVSDQWIQSNIQPLVFDILHKAMIGEQALKGPAVPPRKQAAPLKTVSSRSNAPVRKALSDMSMDEYVKARTAQGYKPPN